eukprot:TRINITY_DN12515_c0_g1_i2.p1 TRINITY_DN12515_c0_g1~~TRINITY_DN12515_c0_g1_i2.p1  ORF type:complete len:519 (-),score=72.35 TRINITY_DN12515_c0_g1_i2:113-1669(-)
MEGERERIHSFLEPFVTDQESENPFVNRTVGKPLPFAEKAKRAIVCVILLPIRVIIFLTILIAGVIVAKVATLGMKKEDLHPLTGKPLAFWRKLVMEIIFRGRWLILWALGFWGIRIKGTKASHEEAPIVVANHISGLIEGMYLVRCGSLAEAHYISNPLLGPIMIALSCIFVDRKDPESRNVAKQALQRRAAERGQWPQTLVFPEGTCTNGSVLVQFKVGAFAAGCPVQPVIFRYPNRHHDCSFTFPVTTVGYLLGMMKQFRNRMEIEYLPVYQPSPQEKDNPSLYARNVQHYMASALGVPKTKHAAEDVALCIHAQSMKLPLQTGMVQWEKLSENLTGLRVKEAVNVLAQFRELDTVGDGRIDFQQFVTAMRRLLNENNGDNGTASCLSDDDLRGIFDLLDIGGDGYVDFQEYLCGVAVLNGRGKDAEASLKWTFECLARDQAYFSKAQLGDLICRAVPNFEQDQLDTLFLEADADKDGRVSRQEFIDFATKHQDLNLRPSVLLSGLPMRLSSDPV